MNFKYFTFLVLVLAFVFPVGCSQGNYGENQGPSASIKSEVDPVCKMTVRPTSAKATHHYNDKKYYFCSDHCKESFEAEPEKYLETK